VYIGVCAFSFLAVMMSRRRTIFTVVLIAGLAIVYLSCTVPVTRQMGWIDAVTGSTKHQVYVTLGFDRKLLGESTPVIDVSPLAKWLERREGTLTYDWRHVEGTLRTIWGTSVGSGHGRAPPILEFPIERLDHFVKSSSDQELQRFVDIMRRGTRQEQEAAVESAVNKTPVPRK
jgi:hypothetical protein